MFVSDKDTPKNNFLNEVEYVFWLERMSQPSPPFPENTSFDNLPEPEEFWGKC